MKWLFWAIWALLSLGLGSAALLAVIRNPVWSNLIWLLGLLYYAALGTLDQLYLAVRLAICESALPADDPPPIVLDDALVRFDDERCRAALELLLEESKSRQILLFTCQHRESAYLSGRDDVTFLSL